MLPDIFGQEQKAIKGYRALRGESIMKDYMAKIPEDVAAHVGTVVRRAACSRTNS